MAGHGGITIYYNTASKVNLSRIPKDSVEYTHERDTTKDLPREYFMFDYILNIGEYAPSWITPGKRIGVVQGTNSVLFLGRLEAPAATPLSRGRTRLRIRAVSDLNTWGDLVVNKRSTGATLGSAAAIKSAYVSWINSIDSASTAPRWVPSSANITATHAAQTGVYWNEGATVRELLMRGANSFCQPYIGVNTPAFSGSIANLYYTVNTRSEPINPIYNIEYNVLPSNVILGGEYRQNTREMVNQVDIGLFRTATNISDRFNSRKSEVNFGDVRLVTSSVNNYGVFERQVPTIWTSAMWSDSQPLEEAISQMEAEIAAPQYVSSPPPVSPNEIVLHDVDTFDLCNGLRAGCRVWSNNEHQYLGIGQAFLESTVLTVKAKPNMNNKNDSWTATITVAAQPNNNGGGGARSWERSHWRWRDYPVSFNTFPNEQ